MDALASICVSQPMKEVIAIGIQFNHQDRLLDILVAGNHNHKESLSTVKKHLEAVLKEVQELGTLYAIERNKDGGKKKWEGFVGSSPEKGHYADGHRITQCMRELKAMIVKHSAAKLHRHIAKRWSAFTELARDLSAYIQSSTYRKGENTTRVEEEEMQFLENLLQIASFLRTTYNTLQQTLGVKKKMNREELAEVCPCLTTAWSKFTVLRAARPIHVIRYIKTFSPQNTQFPLIHYLEKVLSVYISFMTLVNWAHSPRPHGSLCMTIRIQTLSSCSQAPNLPTTEGRWGAVINELLEDGDVDPVHESFVAQSAHQAFLRYPSTSTKTCPIHCEVALVQHYYRQHSSIVPPFNYLGVSKLPCSPCHLFPRGPADETRKTFKTRGTHSRIYYPWGFPELGTGNEALEGRIQERMKKEVVRRAGTQLRKEGKVRQRAASDSFAASMKSGKEFQDTQQVPDRSGAAVFSW